MFADVTSANIVGYQNNDWLGGDFYMMGMQFEKVDGTPVKLSEINFGDMTGPYYDDQGDFVRTAPQIQISMADSEGFHPTFYFLADGAPDFTNPGWTDGLGNPIDDSIVVDAGIGFWFRDGAGSSGFNPAGQVMPDSPFVKPLDTHFRQLVCPFPKAVTLADIDFGEIAKTAPFYDDNGDFVNTATQIQVPLDKSAGTHPTYYFLADGDEDFTNPGWTDGLGNPIDESTIVLPAGRGCWFKANANINVTFTLK